MLQQILSTLNKTYSQQFNDIVLHRDMIGYVCFVFSGSDKYVLKLFRSTYTEEALQSINIINYLNEAEFPTLHIIPTLNGLLYFTYITQAESRIGILYEFMEGIEPDKNSVIEDIGVQTGKLHEIMKKYNGRLAEHSKKFFIERHIKILSEKSYPDIDKYIDYGNLLWNRIEKASKGFCHGDYHTENMLLDSKGRFHIYDFDASANAFPLFDIAVICDATDYFSLTDNQYEDTSRMLDRFMKGYSKYITIGGKELSLVYDFIAIRHFEVQATVIENLGLSCVDNQFLENQYLWMMKWDKLCRI